MVSARRRLVLCVDDNPEVLQALRRELRIGLEQSARIEVAADATQALARLEALGPQPGEAVVIVSDWLMPGMRGEDLIEAITARWGPFGTIVLSGHISPEATARLRTMPQVEDVMAKPWASDALLSMVRRLLERRLVDSPTLTPDEGPMHPLVLTPELRAHLAGAPGLYAASVSPTRLPEVVRVSAAHDVPDTDDVCFVVDAAAGGAFLANLQSGARVALVAAQIPSHLTFQYKGSATSVSVASTEDAAAAETYVVAFSALVGHMGFDPARFEGALRGQDLRVVRMHVESVFDQTPRVGAGALLRRQEAAS